MKRFLAVAATTIGVVSGIIGIIGITDRNLEIAGAGAVILVLSIAAALTFVTSYRNSHRRSLGGRWNDDLSLGFRVRPARAIDLTWITELQQKVYSVQDAVPFATMTEWFYANPRGFFIIQNHLKERIGHMTMLPIKPKTLERYKTEGKAGIIETEIRGDSIFSPEETNSISDIYVESVILPKKHRPSVHRAVMRAIPQMVSKVKAGNLNGNIVAIAATKDGESLLTHLGFSKISRAEERRDHHNMYQAPLRDFLEQVGTYCRQLESAIFNEDEDEDAQEGAGGL